MDEPKPPVIECLTGTFLLSTPQMPDPRFAEQVIYICSHGYEGAVGIAVNKPIRSISLREVLISNGLQVPKDFDGVIHRGGPVEPESAFILYNSEYHTDEHLEISPTVYMTRSTRILEDFSNGTGPRKFIFAVGYAGWGPGQLEMELLRDGWLTVPAEDSIMFDVTDNEKWKRAAALHGIDISTFQDFSGTA